MLPSELKPQEFLAYSVEARNMIAAHLSILRQLPTPFVSLLLREMIAYDWKFPTERAEMKNQLDFLDALSAEQRRELMAGFAKIRLSKELENYDWVKDPIQYSEKLTAHLWATHQIDVFRGAALDYGQSLDAAKKTPPPVLPRLGIVIVGKGAGAAKHPLFRKLRKLGVYFNAVKPENGMRTLLEAAAARAKAHPLPFGHWYIDGGASELVSSPSVAAISYDALEPARAALLKKMQKVIQSGKGGPEALRTMMAQLKPEEFGLNGSGDAAVLNHFQLSVLTEGSGTQIFSTTFVQWAAREALRRAQPVTMLARYAPRQRQRPLDELIASPQQAPALDPEGSLIDADMGAYLTWVNQQRLPGAEQSSFLAWFEDHNEALAIGPALPRGTESDSPLDMHQLLSQIS